MNKSYRQLSPIGKEHQTRPTFNKLGWNVTADAYIDSNCLMLGEKDT